MKEKIEYTFSGMIIIILGLISRRLVLGRGFLISDLFAYTLGVVLIMLIDSFVKKWRSN